MNFLAICLHCLDMRDFHSAMRRTPVLDRLRERAVYIPMGRGQGHNQRDSLNAEITGIWTARYCDSVLTENGYRRAHNFWYPKTVIERMRDADYDIFTCIATGTSDDMGTGAVNGGLRTDWLLNEPERLGQFLYPHRMNREELIDRMRDSHNFYAHVFLRDTHRPWGQTAELCALVGEEPGGYPHDAYCARRAALEKPDEFAALRREGLARADRALGELLDATAAMDELIVVVYSNHGEVFDHFRYVLPHPADPGEMIRGTSHGPYPYEVLYANMQLWSIPGYTPRVVVGTGRSIDIPATILDLAGVEAEGLDGESMLHHFTNGRFPHRERYAEARGSCLSMVREDGWKLISTGVFGELSEGHTAHPPDHHRLSAFHLPSDPREFADLIDSPQGRELLAWGIETHARLKNPRP